MNLIETPTRHKMYERKKRAVAVILHTTGETDLDKILDWYTDERGNNDKGVAPHYMVETVGTVRRIVPDDRVAYHCKIEPGEAYLYGLGYRAWSTWVWKNEQPVRIGSEYSGYHQWRDMWHVRGLESPLDLVTGRTPNALSIGIELQQPVSPGSDVFTDEQYEALSELLVDLWTRLGISLDREHVLGHYDCSPMRRSGPEGSRDPGRNFNYLRVWDAVQALVG